mgnify:CR=1 FL=1
MKTMIVGLGILSLFIWGCATTPLVIPQNLETFDLDSMCDDEPRVVGINIKATVDESGERAWLAVLWEPRYYTPREPRIDLTVGTATFMGQEGNIYYYDCQELPKNKKIGRIILPKATDKYGPGNTLIDIFRRPGSRCLELREVKKNKRTNR